MFTVTFGGWYQRTTLHLSEIYDFLALKHSHLSKLSSEKLSELHSDLNLISVTREAGYLEYVHAVTKSGIDIRYYEDGLYVLELKSTKVKEAKYQLEEYYHRFFGPAISYIFSLGAPTPKVLANIKTKHPIALLVTSLTKPKSSEFGQIYSQITTTGLSVYKTPDYIIVSGSKATRDLIEMQIFFREFKDQLEKYLNIHREIWEEISDIKEKKYLLGRDVEGIRNRLDGYQKTINLISNRINQMGTYVGTRASVAKRLHVEDQLAIVFQYKFETLTDTHAYIKEIWKMTSDYLSTAIQVVVEIQNQTTNNSIQSLRIITTVGVLSGIINFISLAKFPRVNIIGLWYYLILIIATLLINQIIGIIARHRKFELNFTGKK